MSNLPDIVGSNAVVALALPERVQWMQIIVTGSGVARVGGAAVSSSFGLPIPAGGGMFLPPVAGGYYSGTVSVYVPSGATVSVGWEA